MTTAGAVAIELRKIADALDLHPETQVTKPHLHFFHSFQDPKELFLASARLLPHPVKKVYESEGAYPRVRVQHDTDALMTESSIYKETICVIVEPAKPAVYDCELTLTADEDASLTYNPDLHKSSIEPYEAA
jgi:hypothetical protein